MVHRDAEIEQLVLSTGTIITTPNHPFYTLDRGWVEAGDLAPGELIATQSGSAAQVLRLSVLALPTVMWDLTVDGVHTFFVGPGRALVHNCPTTFWRGAKPGETPNFDIRPGEYRIQPNGTVRGPSVFSDPAEVVSRGWVPYEVSASELPTGLEILQRGSNLSHFEVVPSGGSFPPENSVQQLLNLIPFG